MPLNSVQVVDGVIHCRSFDQQWDEFGVNHLGTMSKFRPNSLRKKIVPYADFEQSQHMERFFSERIWTWLLKVPLQNLFKF